MNETRFRYFDICDKTSNLKSISEQFSCKTELLKKEYSIVAKQYEFIKPKVDEIDYITEDVIKNCRDKFFLNFEYRCVYEIKFVYIANKEEVNLPNTHGYRYFKSET